MLLPFVPQHYRRPGSRPRRIPPTATPPPPPVASDSIVSVVRDGSNAVIVTVGAPIVSISTPGVALWLSVEGSGPFSVPSAASVLDETHVRFTYDDDIDPCMQWEVEDAGQWEWLDGGPMVGPFWGDIS